MRRVLLVALLLLVSGCLAPRDAGAPAAPSGEVGPAEDEAGTLAPSGGLFRWGGEFPEVRTLEEALHTEPSALRLLATFQHKAEAERNLTLEGLRLWLETPNASAQLPHEADRPQRLPLVINHPGSEKWSFGIRWLRPFDDLQALAPAAVSMDEVVFANGTREVREARLLPLLRWEADLFVDGQREGRVEGGMQPHAPPDPSARFHGVLRGEEAMLAMMPQPGGGDPRLSGALVAWAVDTGPFLGVGSSMRPPWPYETPRAQALLRDGLRVAVQTVVLEDQPA